MDADLSLQKRAGISANEQPVPDAHPVIVLMIESLRHDIQVHTPNPAPFLTSLIPLSFYFTHAYAASGHSNYADLSVWYAQYPLRSNRFYPYEKHSPWRMESVFSVCKQHGYATAYISSQNEKWGGMINWLDIDAVDYFFHSEDAPDETWYNKDDERGLGRLIKEKIASAGKLEDSKTFDFARKWIQRLDQKDRFFLGMNLQNTHFHYVVPENARQPFQPSVIDFPMIYATWPRDKILHVKNRYLNAVFNLDAIIARFAAFLKQMGIWDTCYFVIIGDSGEAFYEHGFGNHSGPMYDEVMRTFTLIKPPAAIRGDTIEHPISHIDIIPGILDLLNIPIPGSFQGTSPISSTPRATVYMHSNALVRQDGIIEWPWKLLVSYSPVQRVQLFNLEQDPRELTEIHQNYPTRKQQLFEQLMRWRNTQLAYYQDPNYYLFYYPPQFR
jgi:phosphoglycerol transferase MdoB-like AlkP superfamily enzyme